ncbi:MAG TPA: hypothetical protein PKJ24_10550 [Prolixibacteraceae bacterium]|nr:hypothetical protein [Prolixibacteraceae bacterium]
MEEANHDLMLPDEVVASKIYLIRGEKVMQDRDLAEPGQNHRTGFQLSG